MSAYYARLGIYVEKRPHGMPNWVTRWTNVQMITSYAYLSLLIKEDNNYGF